MQCITYYLFLCKTLTCISGDPQCIMEWKIGWFKCNSFSKLNSGSREIQRTMLDCCWKNLQWELPMLEGTIGRQNKKWLAFPLSGEEKFALSLEDRRNHRKNAVLFLHPHNTGTKLLPLYLKQMTNSHQMFVLHPECLWNTGVSV